MSTKEKTPLAPAAPLSQYHPDCYLKNHKLLNQETGEEIHLHCLRYSCKLHGWRKKYRLQKAIEKYLLNYKQIRFWTFTMSSKYFDTPKEHYIVLSLAFRYFTTYMRRHKKLTETEKDFNYVKVVDLHKTGFVHFHGFIDRFISIYKVWSLWNLAIRKASKNKLCRGSAHAARLYTGKQAARYVSKYVVKAAERLEFRLNYYSKSSRVALFPKKQGPTVWMHVFPNFDWLGFFSKRSPLLVTKKSIVTAKNQKWALFYDLVEIELSIPL